MVKINLLNNQAADPLSILQWVFHLPSPMAWLLSFTESHPSQPLYVTIFQTQ